MKLKTLINILLSTGKIELFWKDRDELLEEIKEIHSSFEDSTDLMNTPEVIVNSILEMSDKIKVYKKIQLDSNKIQYSLDKMRSGDFFKSQSDKELIEKITLKHNAVEDGKDGSYFIQLTNDELYQLFSLEELRQSQLNKLV